MASSLPILSSVLLPVKGVEARGPRLGLLLSKGVQGGGPGLGRGLKLK